MVKPRSGRSSQGFRIIRTRQEWEQLVSDISSADYIAQPLMQGRVITADVIRQRDGQTTAVIPREELLRTSNGAGTSVRVFSDPKLERFCRDLAEQMDICGCVNFEFIQGADGHYHCLECNPRFSGGVAFSCIAGYNCVSNHILAHSNLPIAPFAPPSSLYIARKYSEYTMGPGAEESAGGTE